MKRTMAEDNREVKRSYIVKQEGMTFAYDPYVGYPSSTSTSSTVNPPLPGQPPLPPMPPPGAVPHPPHVFVPPTQVGPIQAWTHAPPPWQWLAQQQATALSSQAVRDITSNFQREIPLRSNFIKRDRFNNSSIINTNGHGGNNNRNNIYSQRNNYHRNKNNRRTQRFDSLQGKLDQSYFEAATVAAAAAASANIPNLMNHLKSGISNHRTDDDFEMKTISEDERIKKNKPRKPMSQSYPSRPWNREDAERALTIESEYNKTVKAQSLIIKFPDPDLNKEIVREFHPGIQNIHFQSPSGPRYCFIQMSDNVNIDEAIRELEKVSFGIGHLKVERKSLRDDDNPMPEEIDPYTLYIGNLPESVNVNEVKSKFTTAARVDVGYAQKMRNTRYAFIRYNSVDESISAYKQAHDLMWDTRSIIVRFRRQRGNTCLPGEQKNFKKVKEEAATAAVKKEEQSNFSKKNENMKSNEKEDDNSKHNKCDLASLNLTLSSESNTVHSSISKLKETTDSDISLSSVNEKNDVTKTLLTKIKEEPQEYEEIDIQIQDDDDDDDDDDDEEEEEEEEEDEQDLEIDDEDEINDNEDEDDEVDDEDSVVVCLRDDEIKKNQESLVPNKTNATDIQSDHLDRIFTDLENIASDISL